MVEAMTVQTSAVNRNLGDSFATERSSVTGNGSFLLDFIAIAAQLPTQPAIKGVEMPAVGAAPAPGTVNDIAALLTANADPVTALATSEATDSTPVSVEALMAMDKTAKQGLDSKPFLPKPEAEWSISFLPVPPKPALGLGDLALSPFKEPSSVETLDQNDVSTSHNEGSANGISANIALPAQIGIEINTPISTLAPSAVLSDGLNEDATPQDKTLSVTADLPLAPSPILEPAPQISVTTSAALPAPLTVAGEAAEPHMAPIVADVTLLTPEIPELAGATPRVSQPTAMPSHQSAAIAKPSVTLGADTNLPLIALGDGTQNPHAPAGGLATPVSDVDPLNQTDTAQAIPALPDPSEFQPLPVSTVPSPAAIVASADKPVSALIAERKMAASAMPVTPVNSEPVAAAPLDRKIKREADKDHDVTVAGMAVSTDASPAILPAFAQPVQSQSTVHTDEEMKPEAEIIHTDDKAERSSRDAKRREGANASFTLAVPPNSTPAKGEDNRPITVRGEATPNAGAGPASNGNSIPMTSTDEAPTNFADHQDNSQHPQQGQNGGSNPQNLFEAADIAFERFADAPSTSSNHGTFEQNIVTSGNNTLPAAMTEKQTLPPNVTIETISVHAQDRAAEVIKDATNPVMLDQPSGPLLSVFNDAASPSGSIIDTSNFRPTSIANGVLSQTFNSTPTPSTTVRTDNPSFIAQRDRAMEQQIIAALRGGHDEIRLALYPAHLGQVTINMALDGQKVRIGMKTSNREASTILMDERQSLVTALGHEGFTLDGFDVTDDQPREQTPKDQSASLSPAALKTDAGNSFSLDITI